MQKTGIFSRNPATTTLFGFLFIAAFAWFNFSKGMSEEFIVLKAAGRLLWYASLGLYQLLWKEVLKKNKQSQSLAFSAFYGLIFTTGMYFMIWKPGRYERSDLFILLVVFILMSYVQYGQVCVSRNKQAGSKK